MRTQHLTAPHAFVDSDGLDGVLVNVHSVQQQAAAPTATAADAGPPRTAREALLPRRAPALLPWLASESGPWRHWEGRDPADSEAAAWPESEDHEPTHLEGGEASESEAAVPAPATVLALASQPAGPARRRNVYWAAGSAAVAVAAAAVLVTVFAQPRRSTGSGVITVESRALAANTAREGTRTAPTAAPAPHRAAILATAPRAHEVALPVRFARNSSIAAVGTAAEFDTVIARLRNCPEVLITGHTCDLGSATINTRLGFRRAYQASRLLQAHGVPHARLRVESAGSARPVAPNDSDDNRMRNRRVTVTCQPAAATPAPSAGSTLQER